MTRREAMEAAAAGAVTVLAATALPAAPVQSVTRRLYARPTPYDPPPDRHAWIEERSLGKLVAVTFAIVRDDPLSQEGLVQGTLVIRDLNWTVLAGVQPRHWRQTVPFTLVLEVPGKALPPELALEPGGERLELHEVRLHHEGWGWTEDDLTHEVAFTFSARLPEPRS